MSTIDSYLKALLALSGNEQLATPRQHLLQGINDDDLSELLKKAVGREFARGGLEDIVFVILNVIARDPASVNSDGSSVSHATASVKNEQEHENSIQQHSMSEIMVINDHPASSSPATPATSVASKRAPSPSPGSAIRKRSKPDTPPVVSTQAAGSASKVSLRDCVREQMIDNKIVPPIEIVLLLPNWTLSATTKETALLASKFDADYLSTKRHVSAWGWLLRLREKGVATGCCVNDIIIMRAEVPGGRKGHYNEACDRCIRTNRLCARLEWMKEVINLVFVPLPHQYRGSARVETLDYWVRP